MPSRRTEFDGNVLRARNQVYRAFFLLGVCAAEVLAADRLLFGAQI